MKKIRLVFYLLFTYPMLWSQIYQAECLMTDDMDIINDPQLKSSFNFDPATPMKHLRVNIHFVLLDDGSERFILQSTIQIKRLRMLLVEKNGREKGKERKIIE